MNNVVTPDVPDITELEGLTQELINTLSVTNCYLNYIFCALIWVIIFIVVIALYKLLHRTLFMRNDMLN